MNRIDSIRNIRASALKTFTGHVHAGTIPPEICEICFSDLIQPVDAKASSAGTVCLTLRCPECHHVRVGECSWEEAREFGRHFAKGKAELRVHHKRLADENLRDEVDCLVVALHADLIGPDDFRPYRYSD
jgi:hypothetical protein